MTLNVQTLDCAFEWLLPKIGTYKETIFNDNNGEQVDAISALCVWCLRLRYNLVEHDINGIDSKDYPAWHGYRGIAANNIYATIQEIAKDYKINGGVIPDYSRRDHKDISKWSYKRIFGPDVFIPIHFDVEELWGAVQHMFPNLISKENKMLQPSDVDRIDSTFLEFEIYNNALSQLVSEI